MPPVKSGETTASAPALRIFSVLRSSWQRATTRTAGLSCLAVRQIIRLRLSSPVTANTPLASARSARDQRVVVGGVAVQVEQAGEAVLMLFEGFRVFVDGDEVVVGRQQFGGDVAPDPAETADDIVVAQFANCIFHAASPQCIVEVGLQEEHRQAGEDEGYRTEPGKGDEGGEHASAVGVAQVDDFAVADRGDGDRRHVEGVEGIGSRTAEVDEPCGTDCQQREQDAGSPEDAQQHPRCRGAAFGDAAGDVATGLPSVLRTAGFALGRPGGSCPRLAPAPGAHQVPAPGTAHREIAGE